MSAIGSPFTGVRVCWSEALTSQGGRLGDSYRALPGGNPVVAGGADGNAIVLIVGGRADSAGTGNAGPMMDLGGDECATRQAELALVSVAVQHALAGASPRPSATLPVGAHRRIRRRTAATRRRWYRRCR